MNTEAVTTALATLSKWEELPFLCPLCQQSIAIDDAEDIDDCIPCKHCSEVSLQEHITAVANELGNVRDSSQQSLQPQPVQGPSAQQSQVLAKMRSLVSQEKIRFQADGFDLDLTYITPKVIAMGFPSYGKEAYYRNPVEEVERFFNQRHAGKYRIYNLCSERDYDIPTRFQGRYKRFPFDDHNAPCPLKLIPDFVKDAMDFLHQGNDHVVAVHCKAGKGRTGVMIACLLRALDPVKLKDADSALQFFGNVRTADGKGVTIPSQQRYVRYWDLMMHYFNGREPPLRPIQLQTLRIESTIKIAASVDAYFTIEENNKLKLDSRKQFPVGGKRDKDGSLCFSFTDSMPTFTGDLRVIVYQRNALLSDEELFHFWLNTSLCQATERLTKSECQLDGKPAKSKDVMFAPNLAVQLELVGTYVRPSQQSSSSSPGVAAASNPNFLSVPKEADGGSEMRRDVGPKEKGFFKKMFA